MTRPPQAGKTTRPLAKRTPSERELDILDALWDRGSGTVAQVREHLSREREVDLAYTTVLTMLRTLEAKGWVRHADAGRAHRYFAALERDYARFITIGGLLEPLFGGSYERLLAFLIGGPHLGPRALRRIRDLIDERLEEGGH